MVFYLIVDKVRVFITNAKWFFKGCGNILLTHKTNWAFWLVLPPASCLFCHFHVLLIFFFPLCDWVVQSFLFHHIFFCLNNFYFWLYKYCSSVWSFIFLACSISLFEPSVLTHIFQQLNFFLMICIMGFGLLLLLQGVVWYFVMIFLNCIIIHCTKK